MVADSLPSFKDDHSYMKKRNGDKKNKFKEKSNKEDINVASKYGCENEIHRKLLPDLNQFVSRNSDVDNKEMEEREYGKVDYDFHKDKKARFKKRNDDVINILKNPKFERRSVKLEVKEKRDVSVLESKEVTKQSKVYDKEECVNQQTDSKTKNDR